VTFVRPNTSILALRDFKIKGWDVNAAVPQPG
jgi:hypothetical protein